MRKGEERWEERGCWVLGREAYQDGELQRPRGTRAFEPAGIVLLAVHCRRVFLLLRALLFWQSRHTPAFGRVVDFATRSVRAVVENKKHLVVPGTRIRAHPHTTMWELKFDCRQPLTHSHCLSQFMFEPTTGT